MAMIGIVSSITFVVGLLSAGIACFGILSVEVLKDGLR